jgi:hypothetical protein
MSDTERRELAARFRKLAARTKVTAKRLDSSYLYGVAAAYNDAADAVEEGGR